MRSGWIALERLARGRERGATSASNPSRFEVLGERLGDRLLVLDDQDPRLHAGDGTALNLSLFLFPWALSVGDLVS